MLLELDVDMVTESENISPIERNLVIEVDAVDVADETNVFLLLHKFVMSSESINTVNNCRSFDFLYYPPASTTKESQCLFCSG